MDDVEGDAKRTNATLRDALSLAGEELRGATEELARHRANEKTKDDLIASLTEQIQELKVRLNCLCVAWLSSCRLRRYIETSERPLRQPKRVNKRDLSKIERSIEIIPQSMVPRVADS